VAGSSSNVPLFSEVSRVSRQFSVNDAPSSPDPTLPAFKTVMVKKQLVTLKNIKAHLTLLRAFRFFKEKVEDPYSDPEVAGIVAPIGRVLSVKGRWLWFLEMAAERSVCFSVLV
jgi:hypothetical protein